MWGGGSQGQNTLCAASTSSSSWCGNVKCLNNSPSFCTTGIITILTRAQEPPRTFIGIITGEPFPGSTKYQRLKTICEGLGWDRRSTESSAHTHRGRNSTNPSLQGMELPKHLKPLREGRTSIPRARGTRGCPPAQTSLQQSHILFTSEDPAPRALSSHQKLFKF